MSVIACQGLEASRVGRTNRCANSLTLWIAGLCLRRFGREIHEAVSRFQPEENVVRGKMARASSSISSQTLGVYRLDR